MSIPCGRGRLEADVPDDRMLGVFEAPLPPAVPDPDAEVARALDAPFGSPPLETLAAGIEMKGEQNEGTLELDGMEYRFSGGQNILTIKKQLKVES